MRFSLRTTLAVLAALTLGFSHAQALTYQAGDLLLGVRAASGTGAAQNYVVSLGSVSTFTAANAPVTVTIPGSIAQDLSAIFGNNWAARGDLLWSVAGAGLDADPANAVYVSRAQQTDGRPATPWLGRSVLGQAIISSKVNGLAAGYVNSDTATNSPAGAVQLLKDFNSYGSFQPGGTLANSNRISFDAFNPSIEARAAAGLPATKLTLFKVIAALGQPSAAIGDFTISAAGVVTFTPAPTAPVVQLAAATLGVAENAPGGSAYVRVLRTGDLSEATSVKLTTANGTATAGTDYTAQPGITVSFAAFEDEVFVAIPVASRTGVHGNRDFTVTLSNPASGTTLGTIATATVTISEADTAGGSLDFSVGSFQQTENVATDASLTVTVTRSHGSTGAASVQVGTTGGTATVATDYTLPATPVTLNWADGETGSKSFNITVKFDALNEATETILLALQTPTGAQLGARTTATAFILDGTPPVPGTINFTTTTFTTTENATTDAVVTVTATRTVGQSGDVTVEIGTGGTATLDSDYTLPDPAVFSWTAGEGGSKTVSVAVKPDAVSESAETIILTLQNATGGATIGSTKVATITVNDLPDTVAPTLTLAKPKINPGTVTISGQATDDLSVARVEITLNGGAPQSVTPSTPGATFAYTLDVLPEQGSNIVTVKAIDNKGNASAVITKNFTFSLVQAELAGNYNGLSLGTVDPLAFDGLLNVKVAAGGTFSGKLTISGTSASFKGSFLRSGAAVFGKQLTATLPITKKVAGVTTTLGQLSLTLDRGAGRKVTGFIKNDANLTLATIGHADLAIYSKKNPVSTTVFDSTKEKGKYTAVFQARTSAQNGNLGVDKFPQGDGYATVSVTAAGVVKITGKLADGTGVTYSNALSPSNTLPIFLQLYSKGGLLRGELVFNDAQAQTDAAASNVRWIKPAKAGDKLYPDGWTGIGVDVAASKYLKPSSFNVFTALGTGITGSADATVANIAITVSDGGLQAPATNDANLSPASKIKVLGTPTPAGLKASLTASTGAFKGSFTHPGNDKSVTFQGVAYQKTHTASGYFLYLPQTGVAGSGAAGLATK